MKSFIYTVCQKMDGGNLQTCRSLISDLSASNKIWKKKTSAYLHLTQTIEKSESHKLKVFVIF